MLTNPGTYNFVMLGKHVFKGIDQLAKMLYSKFLRKEGRQAGRQAYLTSKTGTSLAETEMGMESEHPAWINE